MNDLAVPGRADLAPLVTSAQRYAAEARSANTRRAYASQWRTFCAWCEARGLEPLPAAPQTIVLYVTARADAGMSISTITQITCAIGEAHRMAGLPEGDDPAPWQHPVVRETLKGIRRVIGVQQEQKAPLLPDQIRRVFEALDRLDNEAQALRDKAIISLGFSGAFRRSELVALRMEDLDLQPKGFLARIARSKTDQEGAGQIVAIPFGSGKETCPVLNTVGWCDFAGIGRGAIFRRVDQWGNIGDAALSDRSVARIVKRSAALAGLDPAEFAGHSLRAGLATAAARSGAKLEAIKAQGRWRSLRTVDRYVREAEAFEDNVAEGLL